MPSCEQTWVHRAGTSTREADSFKEVNKSRVIPEAWRAAGWYTRAPGADTDQQLSTPTRNSFFCLVLRKKQHQEQTWWKPRKTPGKLQRLF